MRRCSSCLSLGANRSEVASPRRGLGEAGGLYRTSLDDEAEQYRVRVDGFTHIRQGTRVVYTMTVSRGNAHWPIRRRFRQVVLLHSRLLATLGRKSELPPLPPRVTVLSIFSPHGELFLGRRAQMLQEYFDSLLSVVNLEDSDALYTFLCSVDIDSMGYEQLLRLGEELGQATSQLPVPTSKIRDLAVGCPPSLSSAGLGECCVICREPMVEGEDIRVLVCGHKYHFDCISQWLHVNNTCCVCQSMAVATRSFGSSAPRASAGTAITA